MPHTRDYAPPHLEQVHAVAEVTYGTAVDPTTTTALRNSKSFSIGRKKERRELNDKKSIVSPTDISDGSFLAEYSFPEAYLRPSGTRGTAPEWDVILNAAMGGTKTTPNLNTTVASGPTTTGCTLTSGAGLAVGDIGYFSTIKKCVRLTSVAGAVVTWEPTLAAAPATSEPFTSGVNYKLLSDTPQSFTAYRYLWNRMEAYAGAWVNQLAVKFGIGTELLASFSGGSSGKAIGIGATKLNATITNVATSLTVTPGDGALFDVTDGPFYIICEAEVMQVTAVATDTLTIVRAQQGTSAAGHTSPVEIYPWVPSPTYVGGVLAGVSGVLYFTPADGVQRQFLIQSLEVQITNGYEGRRATGSNYAFGISRKNATRTIQFNCTGHCTRLEGHLLRDAANKGTKVGIEFHAGTTTGNIVAGVLGRMILDPVPVPDAPEGDEVMITLTGRGYASSASLDDAFVLGFP